MVTTTRFPGALQVPEEHAAHVVVVCWEPVTVVPVIQAVVTQGLAVVQLDQSMAVIVLAWFWMSVAVALEDEPPPVLQVSRFGVLL